VQKLLLPTVLMLLATVAYSDDEELPVSIRIEYGEPYLSGCFDGAIASLRLIYNSQEGQTDRVDFSWPAFSPGMDIIDDVWWLGISARPQVWEFGHQISEYEEPERPSEFYLILHYYLPSERVSAKLFYPLAKTIEGHELSPALELERLEIFRAGRFTAVARGGTRSDMPDWGIGATYEIRNGLQLGAFSGDPVLYFSYQTSVK